jgi:hypothetical protein
MYADCDFSQQLCRVQPRNTSEVTSILICYSQPNFRSLVNKKKRTATTKKKTKAVGLGLGSDQVFCYYGAVVVINLISQRDQFFVQIKPLFLQEKIKD